MTTGVRPKLVKVDTVAEQLNLHRESVKRMAREGILPCIRISERVVRFDMDEVYQALDQRKNGNRQK